MNLLICETSTLLGSVAVFKNDGQIFIKESMRQGSHSDTLNVYIDACLKEAHLSLSQIDAFVTGVGPGSFTGIRISLNTIKTLAYLYNKPVVCINSLESLALQAFNRLATHPLKHQSNIITTMINAYKNMVYFAQFKATDKGLITLQEPQVVRVQNLKSFISEPTFVIGDGYKDYKNYLDQNLSQFILRFETEIASNLDFPSARILAEISSKKYKNSDFIQWHELLPMYLRASEAEENMLGIKYLPL